MAEKDLHVGDRVKWTHERHTYTGKVTALFTDFNRRNRAHVLPTGCMQPSLTIEIGQFALTKLDPQENTSDDRQTTNV